MHKPTFSVDSSPDHLIIAIIILGASHKQERNVCTVDRSRSDLAKLLAWHLRWDIFRSSNTREGELHTFQALCLLELYEKMHSSRALHERAHVHHATAITLMRRGTFLGLASSQSLTPSMQKLDGTNSCILNDAEDMWYRNWVHKESVRRVAFTAFMIDSLHAAMFGHSMIMATHELRLVLPCDGKLWNASDASEVIKLEATVRSAGIRRTTFAEGLRDILNGQTVDTEPFGRSLLLCGLLSVSWQMSQRDMQLSSLDKASRAQGKGGKWQQAITKATKTWKNMESQHDVGIATCGGAVIANSLVLYHLARFSQHADIVECQIFAGAKKVLGRPIGRSDRERADLFIRKSWAPSQEARQATFSALNLLCSAFKSIKVDEKVEGGLFIEGATSDSLWVLYMAVLIIWCYSYALDGRSQCISTAFTVTEHIREMEAYLRRVSHLHDSEEILHYRLNGCASLLWIVCQVFRCEQWALLHEGADLLMQCSSQISSY